MSLHSRLTREIDEGPAGPEIGAFFDLDRTLVAGFSVAHFFRDGVSTGAISPTVLLQTLLTAARFQLGQVGFSSFVKGTAGMLRGRTEAEAEEVAERIFADVLAGDVYPESRALVQAHLRKGHTLAIVSSATRFQVEPLARDLGIPHVLCTKLEVLDGQFSGGIIRPTCYGPGKASAVQALGAEHGLDLERSYFYTDSHEDLPLLEIVGKPRPVNPNGRLAAIAAARGWPTRRFTSRGTPGAADVLRTLLAVGSLWPSLLLGIPAGVIDGSWRQAVNLVVSTWGELGTTLAGIDLHVTGEEHLWSQRPAVFIFNHQSGVDMLLLCKMLRRDIVGIAKQEARRNPIFGPVMAMVGTVFIDRFNHERALEALKPALDALREGYSLVIAPEGTRSPTPKIGRFKKGAFHMAMAAGVPIVPIVFRNTLDALPKHGFVVRPAVVEATVLPPIPTSDWTVDTLDQEIERVRNLYLRALEG
jgi:putative phosphoserine phosphatase/1-acylglycerol-3-phosphate O-acyltransferase